MNRKEYVYQLQHHGMSKLELIGIWIEALVIGYIIIRSIITFV